MNEAQDARNAAPVDELAAVIEDAFDMPGTDARAIAASIYE